MSKPVTFRPAFPSHLRQIETAAGEDATRWHEGLRLLITATWAISLSLWTYYQIMWLYSAPGTWKSAMTAASVQLATSRTLWWVSFFPALAFALSWHAFSYRLFPAVRRGLRRASERRAAAQVHGGLCVGIAIFAFSYRILPFQPLVTDGTERQAKVLGDFFDGPVDWIPGPPTLELQAFAGLLAVGFLGLRTWSLLPPRRGTRTRFALVVAGLLLLALADPGIGLQLPSGPMSATIDSLDRDSPIVRGLLLGDEEFRPEAERLLATYVDTHDSEGTTLTYRQVTHERLPGWGGVDTSEHRYLVCELCRLPETRLWALRGLPLRIARAEPADAEATLVVEVPRLADTARVYLPLVPESFRVVPITDLPRQVGESDWLVLKIDTNVKMSTVHGLIRSLRDAGVRRLDLAVVSFNFGRVDPQIPFLSYESSADAVPYEPRKRAGGRENYIIISKYVPASPDPRPTCMNVDRWSSQFDWAPFALEAPGALPQSIRLISKPTQRYGEFIGSMQGAWSAGVDTIEIVTDPAARAARLDRSFRDRIALEVVPTPAPLSKRATDGSPDGQALNEN